MFFQLLRQLRTITADNRITRKERLSISQPKQPHLQAITAEVLQSPQPRQTFNALLRGKNPPSADADTLVSLRPDDLTGVTYTNAEQGVWGSCSVLTAAIGEQNYWHNPNRTTTFRFFDNGNPVYVTVTSERQISGARGFGGVVERAYAAYLDKAGRVRDGLTAWEEMAEGNLMEDAIAAFNGTPTTVLNGLEQNLDVIQERLSSGKTVLFAQHEGNQFIATVHAYRVVSVGAGVVTLKDPRGWDLVDGVPDGFVSAPFSAFSERSVFAVEG